MAGRKLCDRLTDLQRKQVIYAYEQGSKIAQIAKEFGIGEGSAWNIINDAGKIKRQKRVSEIDRQAILFAYTNGESTAEVSAHFGVCQVTVQSIIKSQCGVLRKRVLADSERKSIILQYSEGFSSYQIAESFGVSRQTVCEICKDAGLEIRGFRKLNKIAYQSIVQEYKDGVLLGDLAKQYSTNTNNVARILKASGIQLGPEFRSAEQREAVAQAYRQRGIANRGPSSHRWQGGKTRISALTRSSAMYKAWRMAVFKRDGFTCQECRLSTKESRATIEADHIYPFSALLHDHQIKTMEQAEACTELWDIGNGRTLCKPCHEKTDTYLNGAKKYIKA